MRDSAPDRAAPRRRRLARTVGAAASAALLLPLVAAAPADTAEFAEGAEGSASERLQHAFAAAAAEYRVPESVLLGVSYLQSRWDAHGGAPSVTGGYGPMHLTDASTALARAPHHSHGAEDARGDTSRGPRLPDVERPEPAELPERLRTLPRAAELTGLPAERLRSDPAANIRGGAALIAEAQKRAGQARSSDPADWYGAVARFSGADDQATAATYANEVFALLREGQRRTTDAGQRVGVQAAPELEPDTRQLAGLGLRKAERGPTECPRSVSCEWIPAPYEEFGEDDYGNHDLANRPSSQQIDYIVVHDVEGYWGSALELVQDPTYVSWQYTLRSTDGHIAQHLDLKDVGWHAGNWFVNAKSVGLEHEGFLTAPDAWYTEAMYRASARLVKHLARRYDIPLDRQHILGHDTVPGPVASSVPSMHTDPGPYWDWRHYFALLGKPLRRTAGPDGGLVTVRPTYDQHQPEFTGCAKPGEPCPTHGSSAVRVHTAPSEDAPLVKDIGLRPGGGDSTTGVNDIGSRISTGQQYAVAERRGDWTAIWFLGQKAWFKNPKRQPTAVDAAGTVVTPKAGKREIPVYGRAYPEESAYPDGIPAQEVSPLPYTLVAGQEYAAGRKIPGEYYYAKTFDTSDHRVVRGKDLYYEIQFGHRVAYVRAADVTAGPSGSSGS
ncbi:N-acetylmuramoyl-L-alanine amidase [Streptomyces apocyni]|uniref:N-acetylmuramoyl-L-alanine amidase n=1 Tax=Streptomyces apocyni TaxID=2654677 RepID=UPI0012EA4F28|nr:N-acetylmuramoyl-L-alanine amidase [Streptomyces apocyni]